jgi:putative glutathione S-transferase
VHLPGGQTIREARPDEYAPAEDLLVAAFTTGCWVSEGYEQGLRRLGQRAETWHIWLAVDQTDSLLGIVLTPRVEFWTPEHFTFSVLAVGPAGRGLGLGAALTNHAIALARAYGFRVIQINSSPQMSAAHRLYYAHGFSRRPERETAFVSAYDERLATFTYHVPDPLPESEVIRVDRRPGPASHPPFWREPDRALWPARPPGAVDASGAFIPENPPADAVARAERIISRLTAEGVLAPPKQIRRPGEAGPSATENGERSTASAEDRQIGRLLADLGNGAVTALWSLDADAGAAAARVFFARLDHLNLQLAQDGPFLGQERPNRADIYLFSLLASYDLSWRAGFPAFGVVADWPRLWHQARLVLGLAALTESELRDIGLAPDRDGVYAEPFGPLPPTEALADPRSEWLRPPKDLHRPLPARDPSVPVLDYPADWPGPDVAGARARWERAAERVHQLRRREDASRPTGNRPAAELDQATSAEAPPEASAQAGRPDGVKPSGLPSVQSARSTSVSGVGGGPVGQAPTLLETLEADLLGSLERLLDQPEPGAALAIWRLFWARIDWLNARLKGRRFLSGNQAGSAESALAAIFDAYRADLRDFPRLQLHQAEDKFQAAAALAAPPRPTDGRAGRSADQLTTSI